MKKKLLILSNYALPFQVGGSEIVIHAIGKNLVEKFDWDVTIGATNVSKTTKLDGVKIKKAPSTKSSLIKFCRSENPDSIFVYSDAYVDWREILMFSSSLPGKLFLAPVGFNHTLKNNFLHKLLKKNETELEFICHSKNYIDYNHTMNFSSKAHVVPNGVDLEEFNVEYSGFLNNLKLEHKNILLTVANFFPGKGYDGLLKVYDELYRIRKDFSAVIVASKVSWDVANNWLARMKKVFKSRPYKVKFLLDMDRGGVVQSFLGSDLFVFPSQKEVAPLVLLESMAAGLPWVSLPVGNTQDLCGGIVIDSAARRFNGSCNYTETTVKDMAISISNLLDDREYMNDLSDAGKKMIDTDLNWEKICQSYDRVFSGLS
tara:strand:- start:1502 stop:2620 length:1119 start_codon:yes stop_codon:yes gene_type:complete